jgi:tetratricopeptide (TPR) repeat protein
MRGIVTGVMVALLVAGAAFGASSGGKKDEGREDEAAKMYQQGQVLLKDGDFQAALKSFREASKRDKKNPEYLNMVAYTQRKTGDLAGAFETYEKVLGMKPDFPQAREYLGEAHLQALLHQIDVLRGYGDDGKQEYDMLVAALQEAATTLTAGNVGATTPVPDKKPW